MSRALFLVVALFLSSCATISGGHESWERLSSSQKSDFRVCQAPIKRNQCGRGSSTEDTDQVMGGILAGPGGTDAVCTNQLVTAYQKAGDKKAWLVRMGCPRDMVMAGVDEEEDEPAPPKKKRKKAPPPEEPAVDEAEAEEPAPVVEMPNRAPKSEDYPATPW